MQVDTCKALRTVSGKLGYIKNPSKHTIFLNAFSLQNCQQNKDKAHEQLLQLLLLLLY